MNRGILGYILALILAVSPAVQAADKITPLEPKTLERRVDAAYLPGSKLKTCLGRPIAAMSLIACRGGAVEAIPFQIDEINEEGDWVLPHSLRGKASKTKTKANPGIIAANDQIAFMAREAGSRIPRSALPGGVARSDEICLHDPVNGAKGWVYLCEFAGSAPPRSPVRYVQYNCEGEKITGKTYSAQITPDLPISPSDVRFKGGPNMFDRIKIRIKTKVMGIPINLTESNFVSRDVQYKAGPVRIIRRTCSSIVLYKFFRTDYASVENIYYDSYAVVPIRVKIPLNLRAFKSMLTIDVRAGSDFCCGRGWNLTYGSGADQISKPLLVDGVMDKKDDAIQGSPADWFMLSNTHSAALTRIVINRNPDGTPRPTPLRTTLLLNDDPTTPDPPESIPGQNPGIYYNIRNLTEMGKGTFYIFTNVFLMDRYQAGHEEDCLRLDDHPLHITVQ